MAFRLYVNECGVSHRFSSGRFYNKLDIGISNILYQFEMLLPLPVLLNSIFWVLEALERIVIILEFMLPENDFTILRPMDFSIKLAYIQGSQGGPSCPGWSCDGFPKIIYCISLYEDQFPLKQRVQTH